MPIRAHHPPDPVAAEAGDPAVAPWWQRYPQRWAAERAGVRAAGWRWCAERRYDETGQLVGRVWVPAGDPVLAGSPVADRPLLLRARYPASYPWFPPLLDDPDGALAWLTHHRDPDGVLCLLHDADWNLDTTLAALLTSQLPRLLRAGDPRARAGLTAAQLAEAEAPLGEPVHTRYATAPQARILIDSTWRLPPGLDAGTLAVGFSTPLPCGEHLLGVVLGVGDPAGTRLAEIGASVAWAGLWPVPGAWLRLPGPPPRTDPATLYDLIRHRLPAPPGSGAAGVAAPDPDVVRVYAALPARHRQLHGRVEVVGLVFPDPDAESGESWLFLLRVRADRRRRWETRLVRPGYAGPEDLRCRAPAGAVLAGRRVLIAGVGAIGGRLAEALARAGVGTLVLIDGDALEAGNLIRHTGELLRVGQSKALAVALGIIDTASLTDIRVAAHRLGGVAAHPTFDDHAAHPAGDDHAELTRDVRAADLVIDATANPAAHRYLAAITHAENTPYLNASATAGGWGGQITVIQAGGTGCWSCLLHHRAEHTVPTPPADPDGHRLHPAGCTEPTFRGTAADLDTIATEAARIATAILTGPPDTTARDGSRYYVAELHTPAGPRLPVSWATTPLTRHPSCPQHHPPPPQPT